MGKVFPHISPDAVPLPTDLLGHEILTAEIVLPVPEVQRRKRRASKGWSITDHVCTACLGRVLERVGVDGVVTARCSNCGVEQPGGHRSICWCSHTLPGKGGQRFRCQPNANPTPEFCSEIEVVEVR